MCLAVLWKTCAPGRNPLSRPSWINASSLWRKEVSIFFNAFICSNMFWQVQLWRLERKGSVCLFFLNRNLENDKIKLCFNILKQLKFCFNQSDSTSLYFTGVNVRYNARIFVSIIFFHHWVTFRVVLGTGLDIDGIYRVSGNLAVIQKLRYKVDHGEKHFSPRMFSLQLTVICM